MAIRAVAFDIGGVMEITPRTGWQTRWEAYLHLNEGEILERLSDWTRDGSLGLRSEQELYQSLGEAIGRDQVDAFMRDIWQEYLGVLNIRVADFFRSLRPRYKTAFLSNSFVGAREREEERYHFSEMADLIIYSHEVGVAKPDRRIFEIACERFQVEPNELVFLDDVEGHIAAARALGIHGVVFKETKQAIADVQACLGARSDGFVNRTGL